MADARWGVYACHPQNLAKPPLTVHLSPMPEITARLSTALADRYKIERHLGEGGMANVYLAEDLKHHRKWRSKSCARN